MFNERILTCFIDDKFGVASRDFLEHGPRDVGVRLPALGLDLADRPRGACAEHFDGVTDDDIDQITHLNAMKHFNYDPFSALGGKENCTVGALRASAVGHDVAIRSVRPDMVGAHAALATDLFVPET